eukprot:6286741-Pyramimonas_sp.AAC.1
MCSSPPHHNIVSLAACLAVHCLYCYCGTNSQLFVLEGETGASVPSAAARRRSSAGRPPP